MSNDALKEALAGAIPGATFEEGGEWVTLLCGPEGFRDLAGTLKQRPDFHFDYLFCLTAVDWKTHLCVVYHLSSTEHRHTLVLKVKLDRSEPIIASVSDLWRTAEFHEREAYDLMGVLFTGHPDLRRLFLTEDYSGYPLRKDFEDPVNMIKL